MTTEEKKAGPETRNSSHALSSVGNLLAQLAAQPFTIIVGLVVAHYLGPDQKGLAALSRILPTFTASLCGFGIASSLKYAISRNDTDLGSVGFTSLGLTLIQGIVAGTVFYALLRFGILGEKAIHFPVWMQITAAVLIPLELLRQTLAMGFAGQMDFRISNILDLIAGILFAAVSAMLVIGWNFGFEGVFLAYFSSSALAAVLSLIVFTRRYHPSYQFDREFAKFSYHYGLRAWIGTLAKRGNVTLDQFFLGILAPANALGNYSVAVSIANFLYLLPQSVAPVMVNQVAAAREKVDYAKVALIHRAMIVAQLIAGLVLCVTAFVFIPLLLPAFTEVPWLILVLLPGALFFSSFRILETYFVGSGQPGRSSVCHIVAIFFSLVSYPMLVPTFGGYGAAAASTANYLGIYLLISYLFRRAILPERAELYRLRSSDLGWIQSHFIALWDRLRKRMVR